jgi:uncharacterized protein
VKNISQFGDLIDSIIEDIRKTVGNKKAYVAFSGGLDSSVVAALSKMAVGSERVELVTTRFDFTYPQTIDIVKNFSSEMGLKHVFVDGTEWQKNIWKAGPACNACTRGPKLQKVKEYSKDGIVITGAELEDTWGQQGIKVNDGIYSPISTLSREKIQNIAQILGLKIDKIGENSRREGCILKHLLKMMTSAEFHGKAVYESNVLLMNFVKNSGMVFSIANVKIVGPLSKNFALINLYPLPSDKFITQVKEEIQKIPQIEKVEVINRPIKLKIIANPGIYNDEKAKYWIEHGRLKTDFATSISVEWKISANNRLNTFQVIDYEFIS